MRIHSPSFTRQNIVLAWLAKAIRAGGIVWMRVIEVLLWPKVELLIRVWLAKIFFISGALKIMHWDTALYLAAHEYPVPYISATAAAYLGVSIELLGSSLLAIGFMTRYAALPLLILSVVVQIAYKSLDIQLFWIALLGWFTLYGAGPFSVDRLLRTGLADSALPWIPSIVRVSARLRSAVAPVYLSALRIWLGLAWLISSNPQWIDGATFGHLGMWLPLELALRFPHAWGWVGGLLISGFGTRYLAAALMLLLFADSMMDPRMTDAVYLLIELAILAVYGGGAVSLDRLVAASFLKRFPMLNARDVRTLDGFPRVVIVGAGFGGMSCAAALRTARVAVTLIDRNNYHLFQPLLYQVATAGLSPSDIATPARQLFREAVGTRVLLGTVTGVDLPKQCLWMDGQAIPYDYLVLATGATHSYFGKDEWEPFAPGLKRLEDAIEIRRRVLTAFERAEATGEADERRALLTFLVVGGGPTGVELAGAIAELARFGMNKDFRAFDPAHARVVLVQSAPRLLPSFPEKLARIAQRALEKLGVEVQLNSRVEHIDAEGVMVNAQRMAARTVIWAAGVKASPAARWLGAAADAAGRIKVDGDLKVPGFANVFAVGDTALSQAWNGQAVPGLAPAAKQGGAYAAKAIRASIDGRSPPPSFRYSHLGSLATIGRKSAVIDFGLFTVWGAPAWWLWGIVHVGFLLGLRNRIATLVNWFWAYLTFGGGIRLITGRQ